MATNDSTHQVAPFQLSLDAGDLINLRGLLHNTLAINALWREVSPALGAHAPALNARLVDRFKDNSLAVHWFTSRHAELFERIDLFTQGICEPVEQESQICSESSSKAAQFIEAMNALAAGLIDDSKGAT